MLAVVPEGSGLHVDHEWNNLQAAVGRIGDAIHLERLNGRVTPDRLHDTLRSQAWDVLHYIGHGEVNAQGSVCVRLNSESTANPDYWMEAEPFSTLFAGRNVRLVLLNCCLGAAPDPRRTLGGLGPFLMRAGVPATIAMRYEIQDEVAIRLSDAFYRELLLGEQPGRVDLALRYARHAVHLNESETTVRGFVTPILHLAAECEQLFEFPGRSRPAQPPVPARM